MWYSLAWGTLSIHCFSLQEWSRSSFLVSVLQSLAYLWSLDKALWRVLARKSWLLPLVTLAAHPDGNCSPGWKSCLLCCRTHAPQAARGLWPRQSTLPAGKSLLSCGTGQPPLAQAAPLPGLGCSALTSLKFFYQTKKSSNPGSEETKEEELRSYHK